MKKKNGFIIVELLVVIALMLSILGIAIVSLVNVSKKKKACELVCENKNTNCITF